MWEVSNHSESWHVDHLNSCPSLGRNGHPWRFPLEKQVREQTKALRKAYSNKSVVFPFSVGDVLLARDDERCRCVLWFWKFELRPLTWFLSQAAIHSVNVGSFQESNYLTTWICVKKKSYLQTRKYRENLLRGKKKKIMQQSSPNHNCQIQPSCTTKNSVN